MKKTLLMPLFALLSVALPQAVLALTLGAGDVVRVTVYEHPDLTTVTRVGADGRISVPLVGDVDVQGLDERAAGERIAQALAQGRFVAEPQVTVMAEQYRSAEISVLGDVNRPGKYALEAQTTLVDAIALAGGVRETGSDRVMLIRRAADGGEVRTPLDLRGMLTQGDIRLDPPLSAGDVVFVPRQEVFYVYGEVQRPGAFRLEPDMTVIQALAVAGSVSQRGSTRGIELRRRATDGTAEITEVGFDDVVRPNDVIRVREALF